MLYGERVRIKISSSMECGLERIRGDAAQTDLRIHGCRCEEPPDISSLVAPAQLWRAFTGEHGRFVRHCGTLCDSQSRDRLVVFDHGRGCGECFARGENTLHGIVLLVDDSDLSRIIYHALAGEFSIEAVVQEAEFSRLIFVRRRLKKLVWRMVLGQIVFEKCIVPL